MKIILEFDGYEEQSEIYYALHGHKYAFTLHELDNKLRQIIKHGESEFILVSKVRDWIYEILQDHGISMYDEIVKESPNKQCHHEY